MLHDGPISRTKEDKLKRSGLAKKLAEIVCSRRNKESYVIGIDGPWGSGKTSFLNLILEEIPQDKFSIYRFNPWVLGSHENLVKSFLKGLADILSTSLPWHSRGYAHFKKYTQEVTSASISVPHLPLGLTVSKNETTLEKLKKDINKKIEASGKTILIVVDDLDRLDPEDIRIVMKTIKAIADFEHTIFLVAYDRSIIASYLNQTEHGFLGNEYLKKIINVNYYLPIPDQGDVWEILFSNLNELLKKHFGTDDVDNRRWGEIFHGGIDKFLINIRDIKLLLNSLDITLPALSMSDVNPVDVVAIETLRVFVPEIYGKIAGNRDLFAGGILDVFDQPRNEKKDRVQEVINLAPEDKRPAAKTILKHLFPRTDSTGYGGEWEEIWIKEKRVCSHEKFPFYFQFGIPTGSISDAELSSFIDSLKAGMTQEQIKELLLAYDRDKKLDKFLARVPGSISGLAKQAVENLILAFWELEESLIYEDRVDNDFLFDLSTRFMRASYHSIKTNIQKIERVQFLKDVTEKTTALFTPVRILAVIKDEIEKKGNSGEILVAEENINDIKEQGLTLIKKNQNKLLGYPRVLFILYRWEQFGDPDGVKEWLDTKLTQQNVIKFLSGATHSVSSSNEGIKTEISHSDMTHFNILEKIQGFLDKLSDEEKENATSKEKTAIKAFLNPSKF